MKKCPILLFCLFLSTASIFSQSKTFTFKGKVHNYDDPCKGAVIKLLEKGQVVDSIVTGGNGKFSFDTQSEREYMVQVSKEGLKTKTLWLNTKKTEALKFKLKTFDFDVYLKKDKKSKYDELNEIPVALIKYDDSRKAFYMDDHYDDVIDRKKDKIKKKSQYRPRVN
ncbi:MAG: hypothetical protein RIC95_13175 [Vicingaceae bacterium]